MPARLSVANSCSRNWTGISRRRASSAIGTGQLSPHRCSSTSALTAYGDLVVIESIALDRSRMRRSRGRTVSFCAGGGLDPAALGRHQHRLSAIHRAELAVHVVQVRADGTGREPELGCDLL